MENQEITDILLSIKGNLERARKLNSGLYEPKAEGEWLSYFYSKKEQLGEIYRMNTKNADKIRSVLRDTLTAGTADALYQGIEGFLDEEYRDSSLVIDVMDSLIRYYEKTGNAARLLRLYTEKGYESESFMHLSSDYLKRYFGNDIKKILDLTEKYESFPEFSDRRRLLIAYYNAISLLPRMGSDGLDMLIPLYKRARAFLLGPSVQKMGDTDIASYEFSLIKTQFLQNYVYFLDEGISQQMEYVDILDDIRNKFSTEKECDLANAVLSYFHDQMNDSELAEYLKKYFTEFYMECEDMEITDYMSDDEIIACDRMFTTAFMVYEFLLNSFLSERELKEYSSYMNSCMFSFLDKINASNTNEYYQEMSSQVIKYSFPYIEGANKKVDLLMKYIIRCHPHSYITALMDEEIGLAIYDSMRDSDALPQGMKDLGLTAEEMRMFLSEVFRIHDLGSCLNVGIVSSEPRKISENEYFYIKLHPGKSSLVLGADKDFAPYRDIMIGHHKSYDGNSGYPMNFDNTKSPFRDIIDLISIVDSIEAATDHYGRIYQTEKSFDEVMDELVKESGTRYNPYITGYIKGNRELKEKLSYLCEEGRIRMVYLVSQQGK